MVKNNYEKSILEVEEYLKKDLSLLCSELLLQHKLSAKKFSILYSWIFEKEEKNIENLLPVTDLFSRKIRKDTILYYYDRENRDVLFYDSDFYQIDKERNELIPFTPYR